MSKGAICFNEQNFEYYTPKYIVDMFGPFDYDPATTKEQASALGITNYNTIFTNGLAQDWTKFKRIWLNPPFYLKFSFLEKAVSTYRQAGNDIYFLAPISTLTTKRFHRILEGFGIKLYIPNGRIKFSSIAHETEEAPSFGCAIFKIQRTNEIKFFDITSPTDTGTGTATAPLILNEMDE